MSEIESVRALLKQLGAIALVMAGLLVMLGTFSIRLRRAAVRAALLAVLFIAVSVIVTPEWLP